MKVMCSVAMALLTITWPNADGYAEGGTAAANHNKALELGSQGNFQEAREALVKALRDDPFYPPALVCLETIKDVQAQKIKSLTAIKIFKAMAHGNKSQWREYLAEINQALEIDPQYAAAYNHRANAYVELDLYDLALADYEVALKLDPRAAVTYLNRGVTYRKLAEWDLAIADYNRALEIAPAFAAAYYMRAVAYSKKGELELAIADFNRALEINPSFAEAHFNKALACERAGQVSEAQAAYKSFLHYAAPEHDRQAHFARERVRALESPVPAATPE